MGGTGARAERSIALGDIQRLLGHPESLELLSGADLFTIAFAFSGADEAKPFRVATAVPALHGMGLPTTIPEALLFERIADSVAADRAYVAYNATSFVLDRHTRLGARLGQALVRPGVQEIVMPGVERAPRARPSPELEPTSRTRPSARVEPAPKKEPPAKPAPAKAAPAKPAPAKPAPAKAAPPKPAPAKPAPAKLAPELPAPPPVAEAKVSFQGLTAADVAALLAAPVAGTAAVSHALRAHALASAEQFEELLGLADLEGVEPHRYQIDTARRVLRALRGRALLADEVGLGKTVEALMILREYQIRGMVRRALVLVPPALLPQWAGELSSKARIEARTTEDPRRSEDPEAFFAAEGVLVASLALCRSARWAALVQSTPWDLVVVDEAHHVKNRASASFKLVDGLTSRFLLLLTATPIETDLEELYNLVTLLKPGQFATPAAFRERFVDAKDPLAPKNRDRLRGLLAEVMVRNTRAESGLSLPPRFVTTVAVEPLEEERALYDDVLAFVREHGRDEGNRLVASTLLLGAGSSPAAALGSLQRLSHSEKRSAGVREALGALAKKAAAVRGSRKGRALVDLAKAHGDQMLVFTRFRDTLGYVDATLREAGLAPALFHGGLSASEKRASLEAFKSGRARVLVSSDVGGEGQNLHHAHVLVNFDLPYNPMLIEQRIGRLHRMGQKEEVRVYNLCQKGTAEERVLDLLDRRLHLFELVVGEMDMVLGNLSDERDLEERIIGLYASARSDEEIARGFDALGDELQAARGHYEQVKALDEKLFGKDYGA